MKEKRHMYNECFSTACRKNEHWPETEADAQCEPILKISQTSARTVSCV